MKRGIERLLAAAVVVAGFTSSASAAMIGVSFSGGGNSSSPAVNLASTDSAGVVAQTNWNNVAGGSGTSLALVDSANAASTATLTFTAGGTYSSIGGATIAPAGGDEKLNTGFVFGNGTFTVAGVPYANYDVIVYELNDASGRVETTALTAGGPSQTYFGSSAVPNDSGHVDQTAGTPYTYVQSSSTSVGTPTTNGDYVRFTGLTGTTFTFTSTATGNGYVNGFQIVPTPEPASLGFAGVGLLGLLARRRRRQV